MLWTHHVPVAANARLLVRQETLDDLRIVLDGSVPSGLEVYELQPLAADHAELCDVLLRASQFDALVQQPKLNRAVARALIDASAPVLRSCLWDAVEFLHAVWIKDTDAIGERSSSLRGSIQATSAIPAPSRNWGNRLVRFTDTVVEQALRWWAWPSIYEHPTPHDEFKTWWYKPPTLPGRWAAVAGTYSTTVTAGAPADVRAVREWLDRLQAALSALHANEDDAEPRAFFCASAYFARLAEHLVARRQPVLALMGAHRAAEWLLVGMLAEEGLIDYTKGARLRSAPGSNPTFAHYMFEAFAIFSINGPDRQLLSNLNSWRNLLGFAHHLSCPPEPAVVALIPQVVDMLGRLGKSDWRPHYTALATDVPLNLALVLDPGRYLRNGIRAVPHPDLLIA